MADAVMSEWVPIVDEWANAREGGLKRLVFELALGRHTESPFLENLLEKLKNVVRRVCTSSLGFTHTKMPVRKQ